ncbi:hypothetical protein BH93_07995 [Rhodococcoides fascians A25f]|uniref:hypothetical protein n=1 Tax=Rhodococcoides fascians TaxID=1828 RepID=UPI00056AD778|nr:hypothetical protein [Rhodococcus fascians]QII05326.1 hypothetical protein BH93_07995 [Rhodococcus fascians A25f]
MNSQRRKAAFAAGVVGLLVGVAIAISWHIFVAPRFDSERLAASSESSVAVVVGYLIEYFEPAPTWIPTVIVFPGFSAMVFCLLGFVCARGVVQPRVPIALAGLVGSVTGGLLGLCAAAWAHISPPTYCGLTDTRPFRIELSSQGYLWFILPLCGGLVGLVVSAAAVALLRKRSGTGTDGGQVV